MDSWKAWEWGYCNPMLCTCTYVQRFKTTVFKRQRQYSCLFSRLYADQHKVYDLQWSALPLHVYLLCTCCQIFRLYFTFLHLESLDKLLWVPFMSPAVTSFSSLMRGVKYESTLAAPPPALSICTLHGNRCISPQLVRGCLNLIGCFSDDIITLSRGAVDISLINTSQIKYI